MRRNIRFLDLRHINARYTAAFNNTLNQFLEDGVYIGGESVANFEKDFAKFNKKKFCVGVGNGYDALFLALKAVEITAGDEVIVPAHTFIATWLAITNLGAKIVAVDVSMETYIAKNELLAAAVTAKTKAIVVVDLYGFPVDVQDLKSRIPENVKVVNDAAQAHGSFYNGFPCGFHSDITCWSFYPGKTLGAIGDAGAVTTDCPEIYDRVRKLSNYGSLIKYEHSSIGYNSRLDGIQAIFLTEKLKYLSEEIDHRNKLANIYRKLSNEKIKNPTTDERIRHGYHLYVVQCKERQNLIKYLTCNEIEFGVHYPKPIFEQSAYKGIYARNQFPNSVQLSETVISLPIGSHLSEDDCEYVVDKLDQF